MDDPAPRKVASGYSEFKEALERYVVHFVFEDGVIDALCVDPGEKPWALNIKRAIVSMFQNRANISAIVATTTMEVYPLFISGRNMDFYDEWQQHTLTASFLLFILERHSGQLPNDVSIGLLQLGHHEGQEDQRFE